LLALRWRELPLELLQAPIDTYRHATQAIWYLLVIFFGYIYNKIFQNISKNVYIMPGRAGGSRGSAPSTPHLNEARPTTISSVGLSGRRGAPTGAKVRGVTSVIFLISPTKYIPKIFCRDTPVDKPIQTIQPKNISSAFPLKLLDEARQQLFNKIPGKRTARTDKGNRKSHCSGNPALVDASAGFLSAHNRARLDSHLSTPHE
jgi:hypothetical protein